MRVVGFTIVKNAVKFDYPVIEAITSILPLCDEFVVSVGDCTDGTLELLQTIPSDKIKIVHSVWEEEKYINTKGSILAVETNKALKHISPNTDWAFYIQSDEVIHEKYLPVINDAMLQWQHDDAVECLVLKYKHFYGSYDYVGASLNWYRREIRIFTPKSDVYSYRDAQGFRKGAAHKLRGKLIDAYVYHYGWVREPAKMRQKQSNFSKFYHEEAKTYQQFDYEKGASALYKFEGTHPNVMQERIARKNWTFDYDISYNRFKWKDRIKMGVERVTGRRPGEFKNYKLI